MTSLARLNVIGHRVNAASLVALVLMISRPCVFAQSNGANIYATNINQVAQPTPGSGHDYIKLLDETVNPANGSVSLRIEAPVAKQRGNVNFPYYVFAYDSSGVSIPAGQIIYNCTGQLSCQAVNYQTPSDSTIKVLKGIFLGGRSNPDLNYVLNMPVASAIGLVPGGLVANASVGDLFAQQVNMHIIVNPPWTATCDYVTGFSYTDPEANSHSLDYQWITQNGTTGQPDDEGCEPVSVINSTTGGEGDTAYQAKLVTGSPANYPPSTSYFTTYWSDPTGRGNGLEDTNGNCCGAAGQRTIANSKVTSVAIPGLTGSYSYTYSTATRNYTPNSEVTRRARRVAETSLTITRKQ